MNKHGITINIVLSNTSAMCGMCMSACACMMCSYKPPIRLSA